MTRAYNPLAHGDPDHIASMVVAMLPSASLSGHVAVLGTTGRGKSLLAHYGRYRLLVEGAAEHLARWFFRSHPQWLGFLNSGAAQDERWRVVFDVEHVEGGVLIDLSVQTDNAAAALRRLEERFPALSFELRSTGAALSIFKRVH